MSNREDRIVRMGFENEKFEAGASKTMSTLDKLNEKLKLKGASQGADELQKSVDKVDFSSMERGIASLEKRFSTMGIVSMNVINKITDGITRSVAKIEQATIGQIESGGWSRAMNIANAKFQIEGLGFQWEQIEQAVNYGVKDTAYGLDAAATAASQLAASGVDFSKSIEKVNGQDLTAMHKSLRAISGVAAMTNSSYEDIARIFTTVAGNGRLMGDQLLQLSSRGMNAAAKLAEVMHTTEADIRDMVSKGKIDFQTFAFAMDNAFGQHAKEANKTFTGALGNTKAALSRIGEIFASPVINNTNTLFISLTKRIDEFKNKLKSVTVPRSFDTIAEKYKSITISGTAYDQMLKNLGTRTVKFGEDFAAMWKSGIDAFSALVESIDISWFDNLVVKVDEVTLKIKDFFDALKEIAADSSEEISEGVSDATKTLLVSAEEAQAAKDILQKGMYGAGAARQKALEELFGGGEEGKQHAKNVQAYIDSVVRANWNYEKATIKVADANKELTKSQEDIERENRKAKIKTVLNTIKQSLSNLWKVVKNIANAAGKVFGAIKRGFVQAFDLKIDFKSVSGGIVGFTEWLVKLSEKIKISEGALANITNVSATFFGVIKKGLVYVKDGAKYLKNLFYLATGQKDKLEVLIDEYGNLPWQELEGAPKFDLFLNVKQKIKDFLEYFKGTSVGGVFVKIKELVTEALDQVKQLATKLIGKDNSVLALFESVVDGLKGIISVDSIKEIPDKLQEFLGKIVTAFKMIKIADVLRIAIITKLIFNLSYFTIALRKIGGLFVGIAWIPQTIATFFDRLARTTVKAGYAVLIIAAAKGIAAVANALVDLGTLDEQGLYRALGALLVIALIIKMLMNTLVNIGLKRAIMKSATASAAGTLAELGNAFSLIKTIAAIGGLIWAIAKAVTLMGSALSALQLSAGEDENANENAFRRLLTMFGALGLFTALFVSYVLKYPIANMFRTVVTLGAIGALMLSMAGAFALIAPAIATLSSVPTGSIEGAAIVLGVVFGGLYAIIQASTSFSILTIGDVLSYTWSVTSIVEAVGNMMESIAVALKEAAIGINTLQSVGANSGVALITAIGIISTLILAAGVVSAVAKAFTLSSSFAFTVAMGAIATVITAMGKSLAEIMKAMALIADVPTENVGVSIVAIIIALTGIIGIIAMAAQIDPAKMLAVSVTLAAVGVAVLLASKAISKLSGVDNVWQSAAAIFMLIASVTAVAALVGEKMSGDAASMKSLTGGIVKIAAAILIISVALRIVSGADNIIESAIAIGGIIVAIGAVLAIMSVVGDKYGATSQASAKAIGTAFLLISASMLIIAMALEKLGNVQNLISSAVALGIAIVAISVAMGLISLAAGPSKDSADSMMALGSAFIMISAAMYVLALAIKEISSVDTADLLQSAIAMGLFMAAVAILAVIAAAIPGASKAFTAVGKAFLYAGLGAALVGAGIYLVAAAVAKIAPWLKILTIETDGFLTVLEEHLPVAIAVGLFVLTVIGMFIVGLTKLKPIIEAIGRAISAVAKIVDTVLTAISNKAKGFVSGLTTRGKSVINALVVALCAGIMSASPQLLQTIGKLIIKLLAFLGSISGDIAHGLLDFIINLIYGLADAIMINSNRILSALRNVVRAIGDMLLQILMDVAAAIVDAIDIFNLGWADDIREAGKGVSEEIFRLAQDDRQAAEEASNAKRKYLESLQEAAEETNEEVAKERNMTLDSNSMMVTSFGSLTDAVSASTTSQISDMEKLQEEYKNLPGYAYDAILRSKQQQEKAFGKSGSDASTAWMDGYLNDFKMDNIDLSQYQNDTDMNELMAQMGGTNGDTFNTSALESMTDTDGYYGAMSTNVDEGAIKAMEDKKTKVQEATKTNITDPAIGEIKGSRYDFFDGAQYAVEGATLAIQSDDSFRRAMWDLADEGYQAFCERLGIKSPSKVFFQGGSYIVDGLINGIDQNTKDAVGSMENLSNAVMVAFGDPIEYCSKIASGELKYTPKIRPIVDSSSISGSARSVSSMFDNQSISLNGMSGKLAADIGTLDRTNLDMVNELRGLRSDMMVMADQIANMQLVMDTGALVGSISGPMDKELGRRATFRGRRN